MSRSRIAEMLVESGFDSDEMDDVAEALAGLGDLADRVPVPSAELAALFGSTGEVPDRRVAPLVGRRRRAVVGAVVLALSGVGATGLSAAANTLPRPLQHEVSKFSRHYLPFNLPEPPPREQPLGIEVPNGPGDIGDHDGEPASRSAQPRPGLESGGVAADRAAVQPGQGHPSPSPSAASGPTASVQPSESASPRPTPSSSASPSPSPSPSESAWGVDASAGKGHPGKGTTTDGNDGKPGKHPNKNPDKAPGQGPENGPDQDPGTGYDNPDETGQGGNPGPDQGGQDQGDGGGATETPSVPDPPVPTIPLPDPLPGLDLTGSTGPVAGN